MTIGSVDPKILGQLLLLQSSLQAASDRKGLGEQVCHVLKEIPDITAVALYLENKLITQTIVKSDSFSAWPRAWEQAVDLINNGNTSHEYFHKTSIQSSKNSFGYFVFFSENFELFSIYLPYIENTINMVALMLENWHQEAELRREKDFLQAVLDNVQDGIVACNQEGILTLFNKASRSLHGMPEKNIPPEHWAGHYDLFLRDGITRMEKQDIPLFRAFNGEYIKNMEMVIAPKNQTKRILLAAAQPLIDAENNVIGAVATMNDISEQKRAEDNLRKAYDELEEKIQERTHELLVANEKLAKEITDRKNVEEQLRQAHKMEAIGTLAGGIAHDFNNILAAILGYADMALDDMHDNHPARCNIEEVLKAGNRAKELVKQILSFSRKETQERVPMRPESIIEEALMLLRSSIPTTIEIQSNIDENCGNILAEPAKIHQIIMNLCTNAAQAMEDNGGILEVSLSSANLKNDGVTNWVEPGEYICIKVRDTGTGMDSQLQERIFDPYFTTKEIGKGSGMGLAVVAGIVRSHNGRITVESKPGEGATFSVYFPKVQRIALQEAESSELTPLGNERVLIVDDEKIIADLTMKRVERLGYQVTSETSSKKALKIFESRPDDFDLVITDQTMPNLTGEMLAGEILKIRQNIPIIICTGYSHKMDAERAKSVGIRAFMTKPVDRLTLAKTIRQVLDDGK